MTKRHLTFACEGAGLVGTLDDAPGAVGLLIVTGGNEIRSGAFSGQAMLAAEIAASGYPVFRFDRRGVGDSEGENAGFRNSALDIAAALAAFRQGAAQVRCVVALGNCDAASALMLAGGATCDALVLSNPWTFDNEDDAAPLPPQAIRNRYAERLKSPSEIWRLISGGVNLRKLAQGLWHAVRLPHPRTTLAQEIAAGLARFTGETRILLAGRDRTAQAFAATWPAGATDLLVREGADHAFSAAADSAWLRTQILSALHEQAGKLNMG